MADITTYLASCAGGTDGGGGLPGGGGGRLPGGGGGGLVTPGGGGGGGIIYTNGTLASSNVAGGSNGLTRTCCSAANPVTDTWGSSAGAIGRLIVLSSPPVLLNGAGSLGAHILWQHVAVDVIVQVDDVGFRRVDQHRRVRRADDAHLPLIQCFGFAKQ